MYGPNLCALGENNTGDLFIQNRDANRVININDAMKVAGLMVQVDHHEMRGGIRSQSRQPCPFPVGCSPAETKADRLASEHNLPLTVTNKRPVINLFAVFANVTPVKEW